MHSTVRKYVATAACWGGWVAALAFGLWASIAYDPAHLHFAPQWVSFAFIFSGLLAIAGGNSASRIRQSEMLTAVFRAGLGGGNHDDK